MSPHIDVLTLFPRMLDGFLAESIVGKALAAGLLSVKAHDLRTWATDKHRTADDRPFGGGAGMVLKPEPVFAAIEQLQTPGCRRIYLTPDGTPFSEPLARELAGQRHLILLSGHYEGIDQRIRERVIDQEISIGDYVLTNGTLPAAVVMPSVAALMVSTTPMVLMTLVVMMVLNAPMVRMLLTVLMMLLVITTTNISTNTAAAATAAACAATVPDHSADDIESTAAAHTVTAANNAAVDD